MSKTYDLSGPVAKTLEVVGERWTLLILQDLLRGCHRFADLRGSVQGIAPNVLSGRLKRLEANDIVERRFYSDHPPRAEYYLTRKGHELGVVVGALAAWGAKYLTDSTTLIHMGCGSLLRVAYRCDTCETAVQGSEVRLVDREAAAHRAAASDG